MVMEGEKLGETVVVEELMAVLEARLGGTLVTLAEMEVVRVEDLD